MDTTEYTERVLESNQEFVLNFPLYIKEAITEYTRCVQINRLLRTNKLVMTPKRTKRTGQYETMLRRMDRAFAYIPYLEHEITVYRGIVSDNFYTDDAGYVSTSTTITGTEGFIGSSCCILQITIPVHSKVIRIPGVIGYHGDEEEVLLDRGGRFIRSPEPDDDYKGRRKIHLLYIPYQKEHLSMDDRRYDMGIEIKRSIERQTIEKEVRLLLKNVHGVVSDGDCNKLEEILKNKGKVISRDELSSMILNIIMPQKCMMLLIEHTDNPNLNYIRRQLKIMTIPMIDLVLSLDNSFTFKYSLIIQLIALDNSYNKQEYKDSIRHIVDNYKIDELSITDLVTYYMEIRDTQAVISLIEKYKAYYLFYNDKTNDNALLKYLIKEDKNIFEKYKRFFDGPTLKEYGYDIGIDKLSETELLQFWNDVVETKNDPFIVITIIDYRSFLRPTPEILSFLYDKQRVDKFFITLFESLLNHSP